MIFKTNTRKATFSLIGYFRKGIRGVSKFFKEGDENAWKNKIDF